VVDWEIGRLVDWRGGVRQMSSVRDDKREPSLMGQATSPADTEIR
jgi:hypothetical protein